MCIFSTFTPDLVSALSNQADEKGTRCKSEAVPAAVILN